MTSYAAFKALGYADIIMVVTIILLLHGRQYTAFYFVIAASLVRDIVLMPYIGYNLTAKMISFIAAKFMCDNMLKENYPAKAFIMGLSAFVDRAVYGVFVYFFYWEKDLHFLPAEIFIRAFMTGLTGVIILKAMEFNPEKALKWLRTRLKTA